MKQSRVAADSIGRLALAKRGAMGVRAAAKEIGISPATLSRVERGNVPDLDTFRKICGWLEVDSAEVLGLAAPQAGTPQVTVHFKKAQPLSPKTAQALGRMVLAAHRAWLLSDE